MSAKLFNHSIVPSSGEFGFCVRGEIFTNNNFLSIFNLSDNSLLYLVNSFKIFQTSDCKEQTQD